MSMGEDWSKGNVSPWNKQEALGERPWRGQDTKVSPTLSAISDQPNSLHIQLMDLL